MTMNNVGLVVALLILTGCASIATENTQPISVSTPNCPNAKCTLQNSDGVYYVTTPGTVYVDKSYGDLNVLCKHDEHRDVVFSGDWKSETGAWVFGNLILGGVIGIGIDVLSGNAYEYPNHIVIPMECGKDSKVAKIVDEISTGDELPRKSTTLTKPSNQFDKSDLIYGQHEMIFVEGGCFMMGSEPGSPSRQPDENYHNICLTSYLMDSHEVTFDAYETFAMETMRAIPDDLGMGRGERPVINVDWDDAKDYAAWASDKYGITFRLPTEAEWEYACRSRGKSDHYCGGENPNSVAVFNTVRTHPVGSKSPNGLGLYDMSGNVAEMTCSPYYDMSMGNFTSANYTGFELTCTDRDYQASAMQVSRVIRGGAWDSPQSEVRSTARHYNVHSSISRRLYPRIIKSLGFRLVASPPATETQAANARSKMVSEPANSENIEQDVDPAIVKDRLARLDALYGTGVITETEYQEARQKILENFIDQNK